MPLKYTRIQKKVQRIQCRCILNL